MKNRVRDVRKETTKGSTKHRTVRGSRGIRQTKRTPKIQKEIRNFRNGQSRNRATMTMTPRTVSQPFGLVVTSGRGAPAPGKLVSHRSKEAKRPCGSLAMRNPVN